jgi:FKBP-type peptidyl-prolyl cis-trans isomerase
MHEVPAPPKKGIPYPWIVAGLSALSLCLLFITLNEWSTPAKNAEPPVGLPGDGSRERLLQEKLEALNVEFASVRAKQVASASKVARIEAESRANTQRLLEAEGRVIELKAELSRLRDKEATSRNFKETIPKDDLVSRKAVLLADGLRAREDGNLQLARTKFEEMRELDPKDIGAAEALASTNEAISRKDNWGSRYFFDNIYKDKPVGMTASGLCFKVIEYGNDTRPKATSTVKVLYEARFVDGTIFDSTKNRNNEPSEFSLSAVIPGWTEGLQYIGVGGRIILYCPPSLAYGSRRVGPIPPDSVLIFEIELVDITK